ncbi:MAG: PrsW family intramembrane metalloprotease [Acidobacteria bacterium]|nr:PrsW family intramembrane metalloprotease [Acidobacteriota bacterium]
MNDLAVILGLSILSSLLPMLFFTLIVWWLDRYEREPFGWVVTMFLAGAVLIPVVVGLMHPQVMKLAVRIDPAAGRSLLSATLFAALIEEFAKSLPLFAFWRNANFDNGTDGIVYGATIGFGFGMTENILYFFATYLQNGPTAMVDSIVIRTLFTATLHALTTGMIGYFMGRIKFNRNHPLICLLAGFGLAIGLHLGWNIVFSYAEPSGQSHIFLILLGIFPILFFALLVLMQFSLREESQIIRRELTEEALYGNIPAGFLAILPYYLRRSARGWINEKIRKRYVELSTTLAFQKHRLRHFPRAEREALAKEIDHVRRKLRDL